MHHDEFVIRGRQVVLPAETGAASIHVKGGRILSVGDFDQINCDHAIIEAGDQSVIMPGLVDTHVHINAPGRTEWEGFKTATLAAAAGGVTSLVDMPLNSVPPTTTLDGLKAKLDFAEGDCFVDVGFWGGVVPGNTHELAGMFEAGVVGFKCFLVPSGVEEFPHVTENDLREAMPELTRLNALLIVHAELPGPIDAAAQTDAGARRYETFLSSRPRAAENEAIEMMIGLSREFGTRVHIVHLSSAEAVPILRAAQDDGVQITAETCPHYLHFAAEDIPDGATEFKCCPPIREQANREALWHALAEGVVDMVVSDHSPCPAGMKSLDTGDFNAAWGGIGSLQLRLPVIWTEARRRGFSLSRIAQWLCQSPAQLVGWEGRKGKIAPGYDADVVIWNPAKELVVTAGSLHQRNKLTPYAGEIIEGVVETTFLRGRMIYDAGRFQSGASGTLILDKHPQRDEFTVSGATD